MIFNMLHTISRMNICSTSKKGLKRINHTLRNAHATYASSSKVFSVPQEPFRSQYGNWINGEEVDADSGETIDVVSPYSLQHVTKIANSSEKDVKKAYDAAKRSYISGKWSSMDVQNRFEIMSEIASGLRKKLPELAEMESIQTGRVIREMKAQLGRLPEWFEYFGAVVRTQEGSVMPFKGPYLNYVQRKPLGVVAQITPWNHPLLIAVKKIAPAIAAGNSLIVKPSELAPVAVLELAKICQESGLPDGVLNVLTGYGAVAGKAISEQKGIKKIDLTGGTETGRVVASMAGQNLASCIAELGGKAPMIVFEDVMDQPGGLQQCINLMAFASYIASGQTCVAGTRILVQRSIYEKVVDAFVAKSKSIQLGHPLDENTQMGPVISKPQLEKCIYYTNSAIEEGATLKCGGKKPISINNTMGDTSIDLSQGYYWEPTVFSDVSPSMKIFQEEVFGPVVVITPFENEDDAIQKANDSPFGLGSAVYTRDVKRALRVANKLDHGLVWVNDHHRNDPSSPWGGTKDSGMGRENGIEAYNSYTQSQSIIVNMDHDNAFDWFQQKDARYS